MERVGAVDAEPVRRGDGVHALHGLGQRRAVRQPSVDLDRERHDDGQVAGRAARTTPIASSGVVRVIACTRSTPSAAKERACGGW